MLSHTDGVCAGTRLKAARLLNEYQPAWGVCRETESLVHATCASEAAYVDKVRQIVSNLHTNVALAGAGEGIVFMSDTEMAEGTIIQTIEVETRARRARFESMLQEKYEQLRSSEISTTLKCRRCGSADVSWDQKQTRGADEAMTVFCTCARCENRWRMS